MGPENGLISELRKALARVGSGNLLLVGGSVRDLLLGRTLLDYDFLWDGDFTALVNVLAESLPHERVTINSKLLTASYETKWGRFDLSRARSEVYLKPGALPKVSSASWQEDLSRRDFTVNALVLPLTPDGWGQVVDVYDGRKDLEHKVLRFLHPSSFQDDPTRILRAIRLKIRLGFEYEEETRNCLEKDWPYLRLVSPVRRFKEWKLICSEASPENILREIYSLGGWEYFLPGIKYEPELRGGLSSDLLEERGLPEAGKISPDSKKVFRKWFYSLLHMLDLSTASADELAEYWGLSLPVQNKLNLSLFLAEKLRQGQSSTDRFFIRDLQQLPPEGLYYIYQIGLQKYIYSFNKEAYPTWADFKQKVKDTKPPIKGTDLLQEGFLPGKEMGLLLKQLEDSFWQGEYTTKAEGLFLARQLTRRTGNV